MGYTYPVFFFFFFEKQANTSFKLDRNFCPPVQVFHIMGYVIIPNLTVGVLG